MLKFGVKVGIAAGACYYLAEEGIWKESTESVKVYDKICENMTPLVKQIPIEIPDLPSTSRTSFLAKHYWNSGVMKTFEFLQEAPTLALNLIEKGTNAIKNNEEIQKLFSQEEKIEEVASVSEKKVK